MSTTDTNAKKRIIVGISGASGVLFAIRLLEILKQLDNIETHLVISNSAKRTIELETDYTLDYIHAQADVVYDINDIAASISSGSFPVYGMIVLPCSMKTLSGIANSYSDNLLIRAADVTLKERRPLILSVRETPLHLGHLRLMTAAAEIGAIIMPAVPAFYHTPKSINDMINQTLGRILDQFHIESSLYRKWTSR
ncbi:UbiX family flavin prenyltransferase [Zophobihabitans entericus]|uniref:Flavin prenyltransferase UbiX n=1 Tax=Zophobihabitans entericus TaxID=1635327 RepID=A0A6G9IAN7_9GAMM|nr:UbiX family flavin prenyltransferase [Zophobihabitans entericus]QIQ20640.1 UbiX family flavin prenyltransferase [Zophobihabitans entericus]